MEGYENVELSLNLLGLPSKTTPIGRINYNQKVIFCYDKPMKGRTVGMKVISNDGSGINAPDYYIYFKNEDLKKVLEFLIEAETKKPTEGAQ